MKDAEIKISSLEDTVVHYESYVNRLSEDKIRLAFALLETEDHVITGRHKETLERFNFTPSEIDYILDNLY